MESKLTFALKSLVEQVKSAQPAARDEASHADRVTIADVRRAAEDAKDSLRHSYRA